MKKVLTYHYIFFLKKIVQTFFKLLSFLKQFQEYYLLDL